MASYDSPESPSALALGLVILVLTLLFMSDWGNIFLPLLLRWRPLNEANPLKILLEKFEAFASLARTSYNDPVLMEPDIKTQSYEFKHVETCMVAKIRLYKITKMEGAEVHHPNHLVVVIRGTHTTHELNSCFKLVGNHMEIDNSSIEMIVKSYYDEIVQALKEFRREHEAKKVTLCGHSLGSTLAEAVTGYLYRATLLARSELGGLELDAVTFDGAGLPPCIMTAFESDEFNTWTWLRENVTSLLAEPNIVNTCNKPTSLNNLYACGRGSAIPLSFFKQWIRDSMLIVSFTTCSWMSLKTLLGDDLTLLINGHSMGEIFVHICVGTIRKESPWDWPNYSRSAISGLSQLIKSATSGLSKIFKSNQNPSPTAPAPTWNVSYAGPSLSPLRYTENRIDPENGCKFEIFQKLSDMEMFMPYKVGDIGKICDQIVLDKDVVIPFMGKTTVEKSTVLNALLNVKKGTTGIQYLPTSGMRNTTTEIFAIKWGENPNGGQIYVLDVPGLGGDCPNLPQNVTQLMAKLRHCARCAFFVVMGFDASQDDNSNVQVSWFVKLREEWKNIQLVHNINVYPYEHVESRTSQIKNMFKMDPINCDPTNRYRDAIGVKGLDEALDRFIETRKEDIHRELERARDREIESIAQSAGKIGASVTGTVAALGTGCSVEAASWTAGAASWASTVGTGPVVVTINGGTIFATPLIVTVGATAVVTGCVAAGTYFAVNAACKKWKRKYKGK